MALLAAIRTMIGRARRNTGMRTEWVVWLEIQR